ncbi:MAG: zinc ribbon domain-containing protein [Lachnospiraceae bacterium]|nr:zinc ribbon domain-containing protein [Lachnospiraceae bacterium]
MEEKPKKYCPCCGTEVTEDMPFCTECGMSLKKIKPCDAEKRPDPEKPAGAFGINGVPFFTQARGLMSPDEIQFPGLDENVPDGPSDEGLKLLVDCCRKVLATALGDGHDETVLYLNEETGEYQIHLYELPVGARKERHTGFVAREGVYEAVTKLLDELDLARYEGMQALAITGGEYVVKFLKDERIVRITTSNVPYERHSDLYRVGSLIASFIDQDKKLQ